MKPMLPVLSIFIVSSILISGCAQQSVSDESPEEQQEIESLDLTIGEKFGDMTLVKIEENKAIFTGTTEIEGVFFTSDFDGNVCLVLDGDSEGRLPDLTDMMGLIPRSEVCFSNKEFAKKELGNGSGIAKVKVEGYSDLTIDNSLVPMTTLAEVISKEDKE